MATTRAQGRTAPQTSQSLQSTARAVGGSQWAERLARTGYAVNGVLHLLLGWLALEVARGHGGGEEANQSGALQQVVEAPFGRVLVWVFVVGFAGLALWLLLDGLVGTPRGTQGSDRPSTWGWRVKQLAKGLTYAVLAFVSGQLALGAGQKGEAEQSRTLTAQVLALPFGRALMVLVGLGVIAVGVHHVHKGLTRGFEEELRPTGDEGTGQAVRWAGTTGYAAKGVALGVVGTLLGLAGLRADPADAAGLDGALRALRDQPLGPWLLGLVALGLAAFGVYSLARARWGRL